MAAERQLEFCTFSPILQMITRSGRKSPQMIFWGRRVMQYMRGGHGRIGICGFRSVGMARHGYATVTSGLHEPSPYSVLPVAAVLQRSTAERRSTAPRHLKRVSRQLFLGGVERWSGVRRWCDLNARHERRCGQRRSTQRDQIPSHVCCLLQRRARY